MSSDFHPGPLLKLFQRISIWRKLGLGERIWGQNLAQHGTTWVEFGGVRWKLNLVNVTHRWLVYGEYEEPGVRRLLERVLDAQSAIVDSGANIGQMILMYLRCGRPAWIHAFEPTPAARMWLEECVARNKLPNVSVSALALGEHVGDAHLVDHDFDQKEGAQNRIVEFGNGLRIEVATLDAYVARHAIGNIRFWKLDTEGHELMALRGAASLLRRGAIDYIYVETAGAGAAIADELAKSNYVAVPFALNRLLARDEVTGRFTNVFVSPRVAREECNLV